MMSPDVVAKSIESLKICRALIVFNPMTGEDIDPLFLNEDNRALYEGIGNVLAYIQDLEAENTKLHNANAELCRTAGRLERERDAAVACIPKVCEYCKNNVPLNKLGQTGCAIASVFPDGCLDGNTRWEWRGVQKEE